MRPALAARPARLLSALQRRLQSFDGHVHRLPTVDEALLLIVHQPNHDLLVAADGAGALPHRAHDVLEVQALGELTTRVEDLVQANRVITERLVARSRALPRCRERAHHFVQPLRELRQLTRSGARGHRLELSVANAADVQQQRGDRCNDGLAQRAVLAHGQHQHGNEHRELEQHTRGDQALLTPGQALGLSLQCTGERRLLTPVGIEQSLALDHRRRRAAGLRIARGFGPILAPALLGQARADHRHCELQARAGTGVHDERIVGSPKPVVAADIGFEKARFAGHEVAAKTVFLVDHCSVRSSLGPLSTPAALELGRQPSPTDAVGQRGDQERCANERSEDDKRTAELPCQRASFIDGTHTRTTTRINKC